MTASPAGELIASLRDAASALSAASEAAERLGERALARDLAVAMVAAQRGMSTLRRMADTTERAPTVPAPPSMWCRTGLHRAGRVADCQHCNGTGRIPTADLPLWSGEAR